MTKAIAEAIIPALCGVALIATPQLFTKATGEALERAKDKFRKIGLLLVAVSVIYFALGLNGPTSPVPAPAAKDKPERVMHRVAATTPGDSGWYLAESTKGAFRVMVPMPFNDFTVSGKSPNMATLETFVVGCQSAEAIKFSVVETPKSASMQPPNVGEIPRDMVKAGLDVRDIDDSSFQNYPAVTYACEGSTSCSYSRAILTPSSLIMVTLEFPPQYRADVASLKTKFFGSLQLKSSSSPKFTLLSGGGTPTR
jgi:hypothetical protein